MFSGAIYIVELKKIYFSLTIRKEKILRKEKIKIILRENSVHALPSTWDVLMR